MEKKTKKADAKKAKKTTGNKSTAVSAKAKGKIKSNGNAGTPGTDKKKNSTPDLHMEGREQLDGLEQMDGIGKHEDLKKSKAEKEEDNGKGNLLEKFFLNELRDMYGAEKQLLNALEKMAEASTSEELKKVFTDHRVETEDHVSRLEEVFDLLGKTAEAKKCEAIEGITKEVMSIIKETEEDTYTRDAALIIGAQKAEHYEIATYGGLVHLANTLGYPEVMDILFETLTEEEDADRTLSSIAESLINEEALTE